MLRIFIGYDHRQPVAYNVLQQSILRHSSKPVAITPLIYDQLPITRGNWKGQKDYDPTKNMSLTPFTYSRFLVPWLCNYHGQALFLDIDMLLLDDVAKLFELAQSPMNGPNYAVHVVKNPQKFEWASLMLFNCGHPQNQILTPDYINDADNTWLHQLNWLPPEAIGELPAEWNHLVGYNDPRPDAKCVHYTQGIPCFPETQQSEYLAEWHHEHRLSNSAYPWLALMGNSVHAKQLGDGRVVPKFYQDENERKIIYANG